MCVQLSVFEKAASPKSGFLYTPLGTQPAENRPGGESIIGASAVQEGASSSEYLHRAGIRPKNRPGSKIRPPPPATRKC